MKQWFLKQKIFVFGMFMLFAFNNMPEQPGSIFKVKQPKQNAQQIKMALADDLQLLLGQVTQSIRHLTELVDEILVRGKELTGQQDGLLSTNEKEVLKSYQKKVCELQEMLQNLDLQLKLT